MVQFSVIQFDSKRFLLNDSGCNRLFVFDRYFEDLKINIYLKLNWCLWNMSFRGFSAVNSGSKDVFSKLGFSNWKLHKLGSNWKLKKHAQHIWVQITFQGAISSFQLFSLFICSLPCSLVFGRLFWFFDDSIDNWVDNFMNHLRISWTIQLRMNERPLMMSDFRVGRGSNITQKLDIIE